MSAVNGGAPVLLQENPGRADGDQSPQSTVTDVALLDGKSREEQEIAVTMMLGQSRQWLDRALEATNPARAVSEFKAFVATVAEAAKQKKLSEGIQLDAVEMVRRAERALGVAIRKGQDAGEIARGGQAGVLVEGRELIMTTLRWLSGLLGFACLLTTVIRLRVDGVTVLAVLALLTWLWLLGVFHRSFWAHNPSNDH